MVAATLSCPEVAEMSGGLVGEAATYLPGRRVAGVRVLDGEVEVHIVARWGTNLPEVADAVRRAVKPLVGALPTTVYVEDIEVPDDPGAPVGVARGETGATGGAGP